MSEKKQDEQIKQDEQPNEDLSFMGNAEDGKRGFQEKLQDIMDDPKQKIIIISFLLLLLFAALAAVYSAYYNKNHVVQENTSDTAVQVSTSEKIKISEFVISNNNTFRDENWDSPDWIELYNYGDEPVWLGSFYLSDDENDPMKANLPEVSLLPGEYIIILASGSAQAEDEYIRVPFQLSTGDKSILISTVDRVVDKIDIENMPTDISAGCGVDGEIGYFSAPTPGHENNTDISEDYEITAINSFENLLIINEYMSSNAFSITDNYGEHQDWIEIYNPNAFPVYIGDMYLSDDENNGNKLRLPDIDIASGEYMLVYASGNEESAEGYIHAPFKIGENDNKIILFSKGGYIINSIEVFDLPQDISAGIGDNGSTVFFAEATPGSANDTVSASTLEGLSAAYNVDESSSLIINEWMPNNKFGILDSDGDASDWLEIYNSSDSDISLNGYSLTDSIDNMLKWQFPEGEVVPAGGYIIVYASGKDKTTDGQIHTSFSLGDDETIYLISPKGKVADSAKMESLPGNVSKGRVEGGYGYFSLPTPGKENTTAYSDQINADLDFVHTNLYITEAAAGSVHLARFRGRSMYEYIELYNDSDEKMDISGYSLSENEYSSYTFENAIIKPHGYLLVSLKGYTSAEQNALIAEGLSLNSAGERILLKNGDGITIDCFDTGYLLGDYSSGRVEGNPDYRVFFIEKTPGQRNSSQVYLSYSSQPEFSQQGGPQEGSFVLSITAESDATIYYTIDGGIPDTNSKVYAGPMSITHDTVIRAIAVSRGKLPSLCTTRTYILERQHDIPIFCISSAPAGLFYDNSGIYANGAGYGKGEYPYFGANYFWDVERMAAYEYYLADGQTALAFDGGIQIAGGYSRANAQKSLAVRLRDEYGLSEITYSFFESGTSTFSNLFLRNAGQDSYLSKMRDVFIQNCAYELGTIDGKRGTPVAVYINGQYWGLYNLRDKLNEDYFRFKYEYDDDVEINILTEYSEAKRGSNEDWLDLKAFCLSTDFSIEENYNMLAERVDVQSFMDYIIVETFFGNADTHNINFWKPEIEGAKWRPVLFDLDLAIFDLGYSMVDDYLNQYTGYHDFIVDALKESDIFMQQFLERYSYIACNIFTEEYLLGKIDEYSGLMENEMKNHIARWYSPSSYDKWTGHVDKLKTYMIKRRNDVVSELQEFYGMTEEEITAYFPYHEHN